MIYSKNSVNALTYKSQNPLDKTDLTAMHPSPANDYLEVAFKSNTKIQIQFKVLRFAARKVHFVWHTVYAMQQKIEDIKCSPRVMSWSMETVK